jgi:hypothetical protein
LQQATKAQQISQISRATKISRQWLMKFRDGGDVCIRIINRLCHHFGYTFTLTLWDDTSGVEIA